MKKILFSLSLLLVGFIQYSFACHNSAMTLTNQVDNMDGTTTYTVDLTIGFGNLDLGFYGFVLSFNSSQNTPTVTNFPATIFAASTTNLTGDLTGLTGNNINSVVNDSDWDPYENMTNVLSYEYGGFSGAATNEIDLTLSITVDGCVEEIFFNPSVNISNASCYRTVSTGVSCAVCDITDIAAGTQGACVPATNTYTQQVTVTYSNPPASGTLDINGQSFAITSSPQTETLTSLTADGNAVSVTADFSADATCTMTSANLFTAPSACSPVCSIDNITIGTQSACNPSSNTYTQEVTITYSNPPASGMLSINGQPFAITSSPQTETLIGLTADGATVNGTVQFSANPTCSNAISFTAPASCSVSCSADNGTWD